MRDDSVNDCVYTEPKYVFVIKSWVMLFDYVEHSSKVVMVALCLCCRVV